MGAVALKYLRLPDVIERCGIKKSKIYDDMETGDFPKNYQLGGRAVGWLESDITAWQQKQIKNAEHPEPDIKQKSN
ncbi:hypothetical protein BKE30_03835 [Alkanindiges hydrocarboniclasticus]|uniref:AlpA family transcriptional regulator n=2 Tax=Alkanindiges hydrocarboniclasticus TaxID=1907941 RepID=A0A1S8CXL8_9GAMM|nr:hypothetical protein BKE30_03835 [Alkanindiges hydrocarboniclasticus]